MFNSSVQELPCERLNLPLAAGRKPLTENICVAVSGEQPANIGIEDKDLGKGRKAHTLFLNWDFDGITEGLRSRKPDAEPITLITDNGKPMEIDVRSHWRVGVHDFDKYRQASGKAVIAITNAFHTPVVVGCDPTVIDAAESGGINTSVFKIVYDYARAIRSLNIDSFAPLRAAEKNEVPGAEHPCRTQPLFVP